MNKINVIGLDLAKYNNRQGSWKKPL